MKNLNRIVAVGVLVTMSAKLWADVPFRILWRGTGGWGDKNAYCALFDTKTIQTVKGTVVSVDSIVPMPGMREGIQLQLKTDHTQIPVHLGPLWFLENQDIDIQPKDTVEVKGSKVFCVNQDVIMAMEVRHGNKVFKLRDARGRPLWVATTPASR
jgi:hypothetical protein